MSIEPGTRIGPYEVQEFLGRGAMGVVYKAWHESLARPAAVKVLQAIAPDADASARFRREAQSIAQMRHPNILNVFDFGALDGVPYMIVEYVPGGSLGDRLKGGRLPRAEAIRVLRGIASGLDYAHSQGVVHRDVKPANVLMHADGTTVLADFGLAKLLEGSSMKSQTGATTGTPAYMAPEQVTGSAVGPAADRYALASVAYELLTGSVPFETGGVLELLYAQVHRDPPPPSSKAPDLPPAVDAVLLRGLAKQPADRWDSCAAMIDALDHAFDLDVAATMPVPKAPFVAPVPAAPAAAAASPTPPASEVRRVRRWWPWVAGAGVLAVLLAGLLLFGLLRSGGGAVTVSVNPTSPHLGGDLVVTATNVPAHQVGNVYLDSSPVAPFTADGNGDVTETVRIPLAAGPGAKTVKLCWNGVCHGSASITVQR